MKPLDLRTKLGPEQIQCVATGAMSGVNLWNVFERTGDFYYTFIGFVVKMETSDDGREPAGLLERFRHDVADTPVRTAGNQYGTGISIYEQGDLVDEGIRNHARVATNQQPLIVRGERRTRGEIGEDTDARNESLAVLRNAETVSNCVDGLVIKADFAQSRVPTCVLGHRCVATREDGGASGYLCNCGKPADVIVVAMGDHDRVCRRQVDPETFRVLHEGRTCAGVEQNCVFTDFDPDSETVLEVQVISAGFIFQEDCYAHSHRVSQRAIRNMARSVPCSVSVGIFPQ